MKARPLSVLVALDDSPEARAAIVATLAFPWPTATRVAGILARRTRATRGRPEYVLEAFHRAFKRAAASAERALGRRWPGSTVAVLDRPPAPAILDQARRCRADVVVVGSRRRGWAVRVLLGSVSRAIVHRVPCSVMAVRGRPRRFASIVLGIDGSPHARRAVDFVCRLSPAAGAGVVLVSAVEPIAVPSMPLAPRRVRDDIVGEVARANEASLERAERDLRAHERSLRAAGWKTRTEVVAERPLEALLAVVAKARADALVIGARGVGGVERLLMGSVAEGALDRCPVTVVVVR
jgi:nucleotide-binding universal stress UspA family protein